MKKRFLKNFSVKIRDQEREFTTRTVDLSMGGLLLADDLPEGFGRRFNVTLSRARGPELNMFCSPIQLPGEAGRTRRLRIVGVVEEGLLHAWLLDPSTS